MKLKLNHAVVNGQVFLPADDLIEYMEIYSFLFHARGESFTAGVYDDVSFALKEVKSAVDDVN